MALRTFTSEILKSDGRPYAGIKARLVKNIPGGRTQTIGSELTVPATGKISISTNVNTYTNDSISLQIFKDGKWENVSEPVRTGAMPSVEIGKVACLDEAIQVRNLRLAGLNLSNTKLLIATVQDLQKRASEFDSVVTSLTKEKESLKVDLGKAEGDAANLKVDLAEKNSVIETMQASVNDLKIEISDLKQFKADYDIKKRVSIDGLFTNTATQLNVAKSSIATNELGFKIGNISMDLKCIPIDGLREFEFPDKEDLSKLGDSILSTVRFDFVPTHEGGKVASVTTSVPKVLNLGEKMAVRKIEEQGFVADVHYETTEDVTKESCVLTQRPAAGNELEAGSIVEIYIGKLIEKEKK